MSSKELSRHEYYLEGLGCTNCAAKIERVINDLPYIEDAEINFVFSKLSLSTYKDHQIIKKEIQDIVNKIENGVKVKSGSDIDYNKVQTISKCEYDSLNQEVENTEKAELNQEDRLEDKEAEKKGYKAILKNIILEKWRLFWGSTTFFLAIILFELNLFSIDFPVILEILLFATAYIIIGGPVVLSAFRNILRGEIFDENFLMTIATFGAFAIKEYPEAVAVMLFYMIGEEFENRAVDRSRRSISKLMDIKAEYANLKKGDELRQIAPESVNIGDHIVIKAGERVPLDGEVIEGEAMLDTSALTGESVPRKAEKGEEVLSGMINKDGLLTVEVKKEFKESTVSRILNLVENASARKAKTEKFISKFASYYTPVVVFSALALAVLPPLLVNGAGFSEWLYRALVFLVISCPCALVVSIPLGFFGGIGRASKEGVLIKGGNYLEALNKIDTLIFDKTGTLTKGVFQLDKIITVNDFTEEEVLKLAAHAEENSNHPIAKSIKEAYSGEFDKDKIQSFKEISGRGIKINFNGKEVLLGNKKLMEEREIGFNGEDYKKELSQLEGTIVYLAVNNLLAGYISISDLPKEDSVEAVKKLKEYGIKEIAILSGDREEVVKNIAEKLGIDKYYAELLPADKVDKVEKLLAKNRQGKLAFVGDGINDAPVLARSDIGIAMGGLGSDAAIEAADVVLMTDEPSKLVTAIKTARLTKKIVWQNIVMAFGIKALFLVLGAFGIASLWEAVFADVGVALLAVINSMRIIK
ncbi:MAG: heavy metal translocating P-type ATPase [Bacillota bacterium]